MSDSRDLSQFRKKLTNRRKQLLQFRETLDSTWKTLHEPVVEFEERAQKEKTAQGLDQLDRQEKDEIVAIDEALGRLETGTYGICESCGGDISLQRLEALPYTRLCFECAEKGLEKTGEETPVTGSGRSELPLDLRGLSDIQILNTIYDHLATDGRVELEELNITYSEGTVYLKGALPSERSKQILVDILENTMQLPRVADKTMIDPLLWKRRDRTPPQPPPPGPTEETLLQGEKISDEIVESETMGDPVSPADGLIPEQEEE